MSSSALPFLGRTTYFLLTVASPVGYVDLTLLDAHYWDLRGVPSSWLRYSVLLTIGGGQGESLRMSANLFSRGSCSSVGIQTLLNILIE